MDFTVFVLKNEMYFYAFGFYMIVIFGSTIFFKVFLESKLIASLVDFLDSLSFEYMCSCCCTSDKDHGLVRPESHFGQGKLN